MASDSAGGDLPGALGVLHSAAFEIIFMVCLVFFWRRAGHVVFKPPGNLFASVRSQFGASSAEQAQRLKASLEELVTAGQFDGALEAWRAARAKVPAGAEILQLVVRALAAASPDTLIDEIVQHLRQYGPVLCHEVSAVAVLGALIRSDHPELVEKMHRTITQELGILHSQKVFEALLGGLAACGKESRIAEVSTEYRSSHQSLTITGQNLVVKGFLRSNLLDAAFRQVLASNRRQISAPVAAQVMKAAAEVGRTEEVFSVLRGCDTLLEAATSLLEDCTKRNDLATGRKVEELARRATDGGTLPANAYGLLLKLNVSAADAHALELLEEMQRLKVRMTEGLCLGVLSRCGDSQFIRFAEKFAGILRARDWMTIPVYAVLMKVYAMCSLHDKACDLYVELSGKGLKPDTQMCNALMEYSVQAGRAEVTKELFDSLPNADLRSHRLMIRCAGRQKDVNTAFEVLEKLKGSGLKPDSETCNCVLDACACGGALDRARGLMVEMRELTLLDIISYNIMLKGLSTAGDLAGCKQVCKEMEKDSMQPNDISYNCMIHCAASSGNFREAWEMLDAMSRAGLKVGSYTVSIMMQALKNQRRGSDTQRALALLDSTGLDICADEVLLNVALEFCIAQGESSTLTRLIAGWERSQLQPSLHTYSSLIKAYSTLQNLKGCQELWQRVVETRGVTPNTVVLGCMLDALVRHGMVNEAVVLFRRWSKDIGTTIIIYSTLIKGFAAEGRTEEAMEMWREVQAQGMKTDTVLYNSLIDAQARVGAMEVVEELLQAMGPDGIVANPITYCTVVKGFCFKGDFDKAFELFKDMRSKGMVVDDFVYTTMLDGCVRHNRTELAEVLLEDLESSGITPTNFTLGTVVKLRSRQRDLAAAFKVVEDFREKHNLIPNMQVRTCLLRACINNYDLDRGLGVFEDIKAMGDNCTDGRAYSLIVWGCARAGRVEQAAKLVDEAYGFSGGKRMLPKKQHIAEDTLDYLVKALDQKGLLESLGLPLMKGLCEEGTPMGSTCSSCARKYGLVPASASAGYSAYPSNANRHRAANPQARR